MKLFGRVWAVITHVLNIATFSPSGDDGVRQIPLLEDPSVAVAPAPVAPAAEEQPGGPVFKPPGGRWDGVGSGFLCDYSSMVGWRNCSTAEDRGCWLTNDKGGRYDIHTNYEDDAPAGIVRKYFLDAQSGSFNADGLPFDQAKLFNGTYPGPWLQACWGDTVEVTIRNSMYHGNGTSIHWHGIRQNGTMHMDGVNGITQCPIAPGQQFVYRWKATQYGSTWYHSHYSTQYADGLVGPLTLHGPSSYPYDEAAETPLLMTDWGHNSAFEAMYTKLANPSILLNGRGDVSRFNNQTKPTLDPPPRYNLTFEKRTEPRPMRYLLRLINTSFNTIFVFSIDNHNLTIAGADFVPIHNYTNTSVLIGIGQRYNVIVEANPIHNDSQPIPSDGNFWMRTEVANCGSSTVPSEGYELSGILRYDGSSIALPTSKKWNGMSLSCSDETYSSLRPVLEWQVGPPVNGHMGEENDVRGDFVPHPDLGPLTSFSLQPYPAIQGAPPFTPLRIDYGDPIFLRLNNTGAWPSQWVIIPENAKSTEWIYMVLAGDRNKGSSTIGAHPIHLHGHDFAILQQEENQPFHIGNIRLKRDNPPRRDVVLLPRNGFAVIAFKADNPGSWLMHCHIARHASEGLALQILERQADADKLWKWGSPEIEAARELCASWKEWQDDCSNWWPGKEGGCGRKELDPAFAFQDDSGI